METIYYVHQIDPVVLPVWGPLAIRWYGLAYVAGFAATFLMLARWSRQGSLRVQGEDLQTLIFWCVAGVMLGGRLGYLLFYDFAAWREDPLLLVRIWQGGMSSHGGLLGLSLAMAWFGHTRRVSFLHLTDALVCIGPLGIFFGRLANFINGELWGRVTTVRWAVLFPHEAGLYPPHPALLKEAVRLYEAGLIHPRHPSQLYAAVIEGVLVWGILLLLRRTIWARTDGRLSGAFLLLYAAGRIFVEFFREPEIVHFGWLTHGQLLSAWMVFPAFLIWWWPRRARRA